MSLTETVLQQVAVQRADLAGRLHTLHQVARARYPFVSRVALALYDRQTDLLKTFASSNEDGEALLHYEAHLHDVPSLMQLASDHSRRVVDEIGSAFPQGSAHTTWLKSREYRSSYTLPVMHENELVAFLFFDSKRRGAFTHDVTDYLDVFADIIGQLVMLRVRAVHTLVGTVRIASGLARVRDVETGFHLERMALYARLIGKHLPAHLGLSDEYIEYLRLFAPLHDIGKVGVPDAILLKPGRLDAEEWRVMQTHVEIGEQLVGLIIDNLGLHDDLAAQVMRDIVACHHERGDGSGYPRGLRQADIPIAARIVAVADVYDALSSARPYKPAWDEDACRAELMREVATGRLDADCVAVLLSQSAERAAIQAQFGNEAPLDTPPRD